MNKIGLIIKREYLRRVSKKSFLLLTFLTPFLFAALVFVPLWLSTIKGDDVKQVAISDTTGKYAPLFKDTEEYTFITEKGSSLEEYRKNPDKEIFAFLNITDDLLQNPTAATLYSQKQIPMGLKNTIDKTLSEYLKDEKLASYNIDNLKQIIEDSKINFNIKTIKWDEDGSEKSTSAEVASILGMILTFIIYMFIIMYGGMVMQGVMEEKTNRIIEVMISSVKPFDLMMGKIIGIGFVGLTQVFLWGILTTVLVSGSLFFFGGNTDDGTRHKRCGCRFFRYQHPGARNYQFDQLRYDRHLFCPLFYRWLFTVCSSICCNRKRSGTAGRHSAVHDSDYAFDGVQLVCRNL